MERMATVAREGLRTDIPKFSPGDTIRVMVRVREGDKERLQAFEGLCMGKRGGGINETFRVRKVSAGVGVERGLPDAQPDPRLGRGGAQRTGAPRQALLPPQGERQGRPDQGKERQLSHGGGAAPAQPQT
mgnify:CR=1 FL=1